MNLSPRALWTLLKETASEVGSDDVTSFSAAIAYYTVFSLPPLLVILIGVAGVAFGPDRVQEALTGQVSGLAGEGAAQEIQAMIDNAGDLGEGLGGKLLGVLLLFVGATGAFGQLQKALNRAWDVRAVEGGGVWGVVLKRLLSFGMVLTIAFLLLVSLVLSAALSFLSQEVDGWLPGGLSAAVWQLINNAVSFGIVTLLFAAMFVVLPDAKVAWRDVWVGAAVTALLFTVGKWAIGLYLGQSDPGSAFGAAGSLALILVWIYYSALIVLAGAEFTQVWARHHGKRIVPDKGAVREGKGTGAVHPYAEERDPSPY